MSEQVASTVIAIGIDDSGVEAGAKRVERTIATLGKNVSDSAKAAGNSIASLGDGADKASSVIDRETKKIEAQLQRVLLVTTAGAKGTSEYYAALANAKGANLATLKPYLDQLDQVNQKTRVAAEANQRLADSTRFLDSLKVQSESLGRSASQMATLRAAELGVADAAAPMIAKMAAAEQGLGKVGMSAAATAAAMRNVPAQFTDIVVSLQAGQKPMTVLLQQGGQLKDMFGGVGNASKALATYVTGLITPLTLLATATAGLAFAYNEGAKESQAFNRALILTGNSAGTTTDKLQSMAKSIAAGSDFTRGAAAGALAEMTASGRVATGNLQDFSRVALQMEKTIGKSISETASDLSELGRSPLEASEKLNEKYKYLTATVYLQIKALQEQGKASDAAKVAQESYINSFEGKTKQLKDNLGIVEKSWNGVISAAKAGWDAILNVGREETLTDKLAAVNKEIEKGRKPFDPAFGGNAEARAKLPQNLLTKAALEETIRLSSRAAQAAGEESDQRAASVKWIADGNQYLTKRQQMEKEISRTRNEGKEAGVDDAEIEKRINDVKRKYATLSNSAIATLEAGRKVEKEIMAGQLSDLEAKHSQMLVSDADYFLEKRDLQLKDLDAEKKLVEKQAQLAGGKEDQSERKRYLGDLEVMEQRRINIIRDAQNEIAKATFESGRTIENQSIKWRDATTAEQSLLDEEIKLFGKSAEARKIESAQIKIETELREFLAAQIKAKRTLTDDEINKLNLQATARRDNIAAIEGERQALAGAEQLLAANKKFAIESIFDDKERAQAKLKDEADLWQQKIALAKDGSEGQKRLQSQFDVWYKNESIKPLLEAQRSLWKSVDDAAHDAFINIFDGGKNAFDRLRDSLKAGLLDLLYQMTIKKWIISIGASVSGSLLSGAANAASSVAGSGSLLGDGSTLLSAGKALWQGFSGGFTSIATTFGETIQTGLNMMQGMTYGEASLSAQIGPSSSAGGIGLAGGIAAAVVAAMMVNNNLFKQGWDIKNGTDTNGLGTLLNGPTNGLLGSLTTVGAVKLSDSIAQKLGMSSQLASLMTGSSVISALFGNKNPEVTRKYVSGTFGTDGFAGQTQADWISKGGWFSSDKGGTLSGTLDAGVGKALGDEYTRIKVASTDYAKTLGINADYIKNRTQNISFDLGATDEATKANIAKLFSDIARDVSTELLNIAETTNPGFKALAKIGESASDTLTRLAGDVKAADTLFAALGKTIPSASTATVGAKVGLVELSGGLEKFSQGATYFMQNFLTEAEQIAPVIKTVTDKMGELGLAGVTTVKQFADTIRGLDLSSDAGQKTYTSLIDISPAFKTVVDYNDKSTQAAEAIARQKSDIILQTMEAQGLGQQALNLKRQTEIALMNEELRPYAEKLDMALREKDARDLANKQASLAVQILTLEGKTTEASTLAHKLEIDAMEAGLRPQAERIYQLEKEKAALDVIKQHRELEIGLMEALGDAEGALAARRKETLEATTDPISKDLLVKTYAAQDKAKKDQEIKDKAEAAKQEAAAAASVQKTIKDEYDRQVAADKQAYDQNISILRGKLQTAYNNESSSLQEVINKHQAYADAAKQAADALTMGDLSPLNDRQKYSLLQSTLPDIIKQANLSNPDAIGQLQQFVELSKLTSTFDQYTSDLGLVNSTLVNTGTAAQTQATIAKNSLDVMKKQVDVLLGVETGVGTVAEQIAALNLAMAGGLQTVASAVYGQYQANNPASGKLVNTSTASSPQDILDAGPKQVVVADVYARYRQAETDSAAQFKAAKEAGFKGTESDYFDQFGGRFNLQEELDKALSAWRSSIPQFAVGGFHAGGLRIVGENGPELEVTGPSRIYNASQTAALLASGGASNSEVVAELRAMAARLEAIEANTQATAGHSNRSANVLEDATDGDALLMRSAT